MIVIENGRGIMHDHVIQFNIRLRGMAIQSTHSLDAVIVQSLWSGGLKARILELKGPHHQFPSIVNRYTNYLYAYVNM